MNTFAYMSTKKQPTIPMHRMDVNTPFGMQFGYYETDSKYAENTKSEKYIAHRDDYYLFLFIDTEETILTILKTSEYRENKYFMSAPAKYTSHL